MCSGNITYPAVEKATTKKYKDGIAVDNCKHDQPWWSSVIYVVCYFAAVFVLTHSGICSGLLSCHYARSSAIFCVNSFILLMKSPVGI